jgi:hypothetical protein
MIIVEEHRRVILSFGGAFSHPVARCRVLVGLVGSEDEFL